MKMSSLWKCQFIFHATFFVLAVIGLIKSGSWAGFLYLFASLFVSFVFWVLSSKFRSGGIDQ